MSGKKKSKVKIIIGLISIVFLAAVVFVALNFSSIAKTTAERIATKTLGVDVKIGALDLNLAEKSIEVRDLTIDNPKGFKKPRALELGLIRITADELGKEKLVFKEVIVSDTNILFEVKGDGASNLTTIKNGIKTSPKSEEKASDAAPIKVIVRDFQLNKASLEPAVALVKKDLPTVTMPNIRLRGIGEKENGVLAREAIAQIFKKISDVAVKESAKSGFLEGVSKDKLKDLGVSSSVIDSIGGDGEKAVEEIGNKVKNLF